MQDFLYLKLLDRIKPLFSSMGIDYTIMRRILEVKLIMDGRRTSTFNQEKPKGKHPFLASLAIYAFLGIFIGIFMLFSFPLFLKMNIVLGMIIFIILTTMISDFSSVLLDVRDKSILLARPVKAKTLNTAKLLHIVYYLFSITMAIAGLSLIVSLFKYGFLFFLTMLIILVLICSLTILFTSIFYFAILHLFSGEKLRDIINYFQISLSIFMTVSYQLIGRLFNIVDMQVQISMHWWNFLLPSSWFAAPFSVLFANEHGLYYILLSLTGVIIPIIALILYIKIAAPAFEKNLQKLTSSSGSKESFKKHSLMQIVSGLICYNRTEKVFFKFTCNMLKSERKLKLKLFPSLTLGVIMPFIMIFSTASHSKSISEFLSTIANGEYFLYLYISLILFSNLFMIISMSENYRGAWIYKVLPVGDPGQILKGSMKAFIYKYIIPFFLLTCLIFIAICGMKIILDLILIFINLMTIMLALLKFSKKELPFYKDFDSTQGAGNIGPLILSFVLCGGLAAAHYQFNKHFSYGIVFDLIISLLLFVFFWNTSFHISWKDIIKDA